MHFGPSPRTKLHDFCIFEGLKINKIYYSGGNKKMRQELSTIFQENWIAYGKAKG